MGRQRAFRSSLDLVKKAELARRGYRIGGAFLPPVGRLEKPTDRLQCGELRRLLRSLNEELVAHASADLRAQSETSHGTPLKALMGSFNNTSSTNEDTSAPSLLVTALSKHHAVAALAVESALRSWLFALISPLWESQRGQNTGSTHLVVRMRDCQRLLERSCELFHAWESVLERQSRRVSAVVRADMPSPSTESSHDCDDQVTKASSQSTSDQVRFRQIESRLHELWSACETLGSLVVAARHDLSTTDAATDAPSAGKGDPSTETWANRLASSRELMEKRVQELRDSWEAYDQALAAALSTSESDDQRKSDPSPDPDEISDGQDKNAPLQRVKPPEQREEDDCTFVFTGTSTGEKDFDLKSILRQQDDASRAPATGRLFVRELRDVLAYREANTRSRTITKDIDADATGSTVGAGGFAATPREFPTRQPRVEMRPVDLRAALKSELQDLVVRLPLIINDDDSDDDELSDGIE